MEIEILKTFKDHPFKVQDDSDMKFLKESIQRLRQRSAKRKLSIGRRWEYSLFHNFRYLKNTDRPVF